MFEVLIGIILRSQYLAERSDQCKRSSWIAMASSTGIAHRETTSIGGRSLSFLPGALDVIARFTQAGFRLLVITNQACVGKGIVSWATVQEIHARMVKEIGQVGGQIEGCSAAHTWRIPVANVARQRQDCSSYVPKRGIGWT